MEFEEKAVLLTAESKPYDFNGNTGVSHKIRLMIGGEIFEMKSSPEQVSELANDLKKSGLAKLKISSPKEKLKMELVGFSPDEA